MANIWKLLRILPQYKYDLSFSLSRDPDMLAPMDWAVYRQDIDRSRHFSQLFVRNAPIVVPSPNKGEIVSARYRAFIDQSDVSGSSLFFDIGCGVGNWFFEFMALEGRAKIRIVGIDIS